MPPRATGAMNPIFDDKIAESFLNFRYFKAALKKYESSWTYLINNEVFHMKYEIFKVLQGNFEVIRLCVVRMAGALW